MFFKLNILIIYFNFRNIQIYKILHKILNLFLILKVFYILYIFLIFRYFFLKLNKFSIIIKM